MTDALLLSRVKERQQAPPLFEWDEYQIARSEFEYRREADDYADETDDEIWESVYDDQFLFEDAWDWLVESITEWIERINPKGGWYVEATGLGWQNRDEFAAFETTDGAEFVRRVFGFDTNQFTLRLWGDQDGTHILRGSVAHHDSPTGEGRTVFPSPICDQCGDVIFPDGPVEVEAYGCKYLCCAYCAEDATNSD